MSKVTFETGLEQALISAAEDSENAAGFLEQYKQTKRYLENEMYPWVQSNCSWYTDHGEQHITAVMNQASRLLKNELRDLDEGDLNELDLFILLTGILWHDVGMIIDRSEHERISTEVNSRFRDIAFPSTSIKATTDDIIKGHRHQAGLNIPKKSATFNIKGGVYKIYPKSLAGILRFADEISETQERVSGDTWVRETVPEESEIFWRYAETIQGCHPHLNAKAINLNIEVSFERATEMYPCPGSFEERRNENGEISLIEYIICRLEKLVNELSYCERYFNRYAEIREANVEITIRDDSNNIIKEINETLAAAGLTTKGNYPNINIYDEFFEEYSEWKPHQLPESDQIDTAGSGLPHGGKGQ
ncbi:HD domain-containing protein [Haloarcula sp. KBTZ06]|uniref:HD domain-containing protein n=1 Tax=Haloarcula sp. KBTZ06 TaxID=3402682 RepID=UPI003B430683